MAQSSRHHSPEEWLRRLNRAAAAMNPFLTVLAVGLAILSATCFALLAKDLPIVHLRLQTQSCPSPPAGEFRER